VAGSSIEGCVGSGGIVIFGRYLSADRIIAGSGGSDTGDTMMMSLYFTLGVFLPIAVGNPAAHRSLIAFAAWSSFACCDDIDTGTRNAQYAHKISGRIGCAGDDWGGSDCAGSGEKGG